MAALPPPPTGAEQGDFIWTSWYNSLYALLTTTGTLAWSQVDKTGSNLSDLANRPHSALTSFQGGVPGEYYHLSAAQYASLGTGAHNDLLSKQGGATNEYYHLSLPDYNKAVASREKLSGNRTYYVATTGSDSNNGLTAGAPFLTIQKAVDVVCDTLDTGIYTVTISVANGTYASAVTFKPYVGGGTVALVGNTGTPANVLITGAFPCINALECRAWSINGFKLVSSTADGIQAVGASTVTLSNIEFGACAASCIGSYAGARVTLLTGMSVSASQGSACFNSQGGSFSCENRTVTLSGTPNFPAGFYLGTGPTFNTMYSMTFAGTGATGPRYNISLNNACYVNGAGATYFPGSVAGITATGAQYA